MAAEYAIFMLNTDHIYIVEVKQIGRLAVISKVVLIDFEPHLRRIVIAVRLIIHRNCPAVYIGYIQRDGFEKVCSEGGNTT